MNNKIPKVCGICQTELNFSRRDLQKIDMLLKQALHGRYYISEEMVVNLFHPIAHKLHTEVK